jgi:hypothetical protein
VNRPYISRRQRLVQFLQDAVQIFAENLPHLANPTLLRKRRIIKILGLDLQVGDNVI